MIKEFEAYKHIDELTRAHGISKEDLYKWGQNYGSMAQNPLLVTEKIINLSKAPQVSQTKLQNVHRA